VSGVSFLFLPLFYFVFLEFEWERKKGKQDEFKRRLDSLKKGQAIPTWKGT
jgi:preprotein translocase subunit YajC